MYPTGIMTISTKVWIVLVVLISLLVLNVKGLTRPFAVIFVAPKGTPTHFLGLPSRLLHRLLGNFLATFGLSSNF